VLASAEVFRAPATLGAPAICCPDVDARLSRDGLAAWTESEPKQQRQHHN